MLSINSAVAVAIGLRAAPGEVPVWGAFAAATMVATALLLANVWGEPGQRL
ncbi:MAG TPA: hypothetical protein VFU22_05415 [Roseiflexaceae bacterium]|nr:hypothetical protein [Roseiflexaceae bacterium]